MTILLFFLFCNSWAQIEINNSIKNIPGDTLQISNVGIPNDSTELTTLNYVRNSNSIFITGNLINDTLSGNYDTTLYSIQTGLVLFVVANQTNASKLVLKLNSNYYPVVKNNSFQVEKGEVIANKIMLLAFDGTKFIYLNATRGNCPTGYSKVNDQYCIQKTERQGSFWTAMSNCASEGSKLCSWSEWYYACLNRSALGLTQMTNLNWEWINQSQNEVYQGKAVGRGKCDITIHRDAVTLDYYRCCFDF